MKVTIEIPYDIVELARRAAVDDGYATPSPDLLAKFFAEDVRTMYRNMVEGYESNLRDAVQSFMYVEQPTSSK